MDDQSYFMDALQQQPQPPEFQAQGISEQDQEIWSGIVEWYEIENKSGDQSKIKRLIPFAIRPLNNQIDVTDLNIDLWPQRITMQLMPKHKIGQQYLRESKQVIFVPTSCESLKALIRVMSVGFLGRIHIDLSTNTTESELKLLILAYFPVQKTFICFIPNDRNGCIEHINEKTMEIMKPIWSGTIKWYRDQNDQETIEQHTPFTARENGEAKVKTDYWPQILNMKFIPKQMVGDAGIQSLKDSRLLIFFPTPGESFEALLKFMGSNLFGCIHLATSHSNQCECKLLVLRCLPERRILIGSLPNDPAIFVEYLRKVVLQEKQQLTDHDIESKPQSHVKSEVQQNQEIVNTNQMEPQ